MGRVCNGPRVLWAEMSRNRDWNFLTASECAEDSVTMVTSLVRARTNPPITRSW